MHANKIDNKNAATMHYAIDISSRCMQVDKPQAAYTAVLKSNHKVVETEKSSTVVVHQLAVRQRIRYECEDLQKHSNIFAKALTVQGTAPYCTVPAVSIITINLLSP